MEQEVESRFFSTRDRPCYSASGKKDDELVWYKAKPKSDDEGSQMKEPGFPRLPSLKLEDGDAGESLDFEELEKRRAIENQTCSIKKRQSEAFLKWCKEVRPDLWKEPEKVNGVYVLPLPEHPSMQRLRECKGSELPWDNEEEECSFDWRTKPWPYI